jgi:hypothetical protein
LVEVRIGNLTVRALQLDALKSWVADNIPFVRWIAGYLSLKSLATIDVCKYREPTTIPDVIEDVHDPI